MFRKNDKHTQPALISSVNDLPAKQRERLAQSWAGVFYREFFSRLQEDPFAVLYADMPSRPNVPVNVLVGLEYLKAGFGWTDEELYDAFAFDMQVRYALGYQQWGEGDFDLRTLYYFRQRLSEHMQTSGENLLEQAFEQVTDEQLAAFGLKTGEQRMDSTMVASNIRQMGRVQLLVTVLQRVQRMLSEADQGHYAEVLAPYLKGHAGQYVYRLRGQDMSSHVQRMGVVMQQLLTALEPGYGAEPVYHVLARVFSEHFRLEKDALRVKAGEELSASSLQSPDDLEATYREKKGIGYRGYVANLTETCDLDNPLQLITKVQTAPNHTDDPALLAAAVPDLAARTDLATLYTDGGHGGPEADQVLHQHGVSHIQTALRGRQPETDRLSLADFELKTADTGQVTEVTCPAHQTVTVQPGRTPERFIARFEPETCLTCPLRARCPAQPGQRDKRYSLRFSQPQAHVAQRRRRSLTQTDGKNRRAAIEATVRSVKHPFPAGKVPVRGLFRVSCLLIGSAAVSNLRRIGRYLNAKNQPTKPPVVPQRGGQGSPEEQEPSTFVLVLAMFRRCFGLMSLPKLGLGC